ncbi:beta-ketoacyl-[acyl-carrier-protein] synthase I [Arenicella chitinivorans]|uniref:3-oxoacyl-[acyl-carrier-protein] synthase 1 n=1 Tax=Arenicella chitinivorans TaxID=1329800 RepID=A0A918VM26_9GAMM|nr:beta-ketoacyl-ACP synthase I [Arenicella chitinivorans]GHA07380.1 beta-ketoacyl-[acyl-carrier-protein] synthase I [Arenicella chitinivorans]
MNRVVVTGMGVVSSLGNDVATVTESLRTGKSGIQFCEDYAELGMRSQIAGRIHIDQAALIDRKKLRFMGDAAAFSYIAMQQAIEDAGLELDQLKDPKVGLITGSGGGSPANNVLAAQIAKERGVKRIGPYAVPKTMASTTSACLSTMFGIQGASYSISSACSTSAHCIGHAADIIRSGRHHTVFAGGGEEEHWTMSILFDAMGAMSSKYNDTPTQASRTYDANRDGFVIAGGGGILVLEDYEHAKARGAKIYAELVGFGATSDGYDMVAPSGEGAVRCMQQAMENVKGSVDYVNTHGTSTPVGDVKELEAIKAVFKDKIPFISATKSLSGHALGAAGVHEAIYSLIMMKEKFLAASANIRELDPAALGLPILLENLSQKVKTIMSNSFGFGGTNATLVFQEV